MRLVDTIYLLLRRLSEILSRNGNEAANLGWPNKRGSDRNRSLPVSAGYRTLTRSWGLGGEVRIGQVAVQHLRNLSSSASLGRADVIGSVPL
jgi:hypothetical protein